MVTSPSPSFKMEMISSVLVLIRKRTTCSRMTLKMPFQVPIHTDSQPSLLSDRTWREALPVQDSLLRPFCFSLSLHQIVYSDIGVGSQEGDLTLVFFGQLAGDCRVVSSFITSQAAPLAMQGPGCCHQHGEARPQAYQQGSVIQDIDKHHLREGLLFGISNCWILGIGGQVPCSPGSFCQDVAAVVGPHGISGMGPSQRLSQGAPSSVVTKDVLVSSFR